MLPNSRPRTRSAGFPPAKDRACIRGGRFPPSRARRPPGDGLGRRHAACRAGLLRVRRDAPVHGHRRQAEACGPGKPAPAQEPPGESPGQPRRRPVRGGLEPARLRLDRGARRHSRRRSRLGAGVGSAPREVPAVPGVAGAGERPGHSDPSRAGCHLAGRPGLGEIASSWKGPTGAVAVWGRGGPLRRGPPAPGGHDGRWGRRPARGPLGAGGEKARSSAPGLASASTFAEACLASVGSRAGGERGTEELLWI